MSAWQDLYLPLKKGLNLSAGSVLSGDELQVAENVDWDRDGVIKGRPSRLAPDMFVVNNAAAVPLASTGYMARGLVRLRDLSGERPALVTDGRLFSHEGAQWSDRGGCGSAQVDQPYLFVKSKAGTKRLPTTLDFGLDDTNTVTAATLLNSAFSRDRSVSTGLTVGTAKGTGAKADTTTAVVFQATGGNTLRMLYRTAGGTTLTSVALAADASSTPTDRLAPVICGSNGVSQFWVAYKTTTADQVKVLSVSVTGSVLGSGTFTLTGLKGFWLDNSSSGTNRLVLGMTNASGLTVKVINATSLVTTGFDSTFTRGGDTDAGEVVVGVTSTTSATFVYRAFDASGVSDGDLVIGTVSLTAGLSAVSLAQLYGGGAFPNAAVHWGICHQPIVVNGRTYVTLVAAAVLAATTGTWLALDITELANNGAGFPVGAVLVARGEADATIPWTSAAMAIPVTNGWVFPTVDWARFSASTTALTGQDAALGLNRVQVLGPREALVNETTVISGSVPHSLQRGACAELGFPFLAGQPGLDASVTAGGSIGIGSYTLAAVWRWTDETGAIHRSAPSPLRTVPTTSGNNTLVLNVTNPQLTERPQGSVAIELYCTVRDPDVAGAHFLIGTYDVVGGQVATQITLTTLLAGMDATPTVNPGTETLYTDGGAFAHYHVPGDGGVTALGRRVWMAGASTAFCSKLLVPGWAPGFNDEGQLQVNLPAGAGRILALEAMDDKLIIFCARGVFALRDGGPDNAGQGLDFGPPERVTDLGVAGPRSTCWTPQGLVFVVPSSAKSDQAGPWLLTRDLQLKYLGQPIQDYCVTDAVPEVAYSPEREAVFLSFNQSGTTGVVLIDLRTGRWGVWLNRDASDGTIRSMTTSGGYLWTLCTEVAPLSGTPGTDAGTAGAYSMRIRTSHLYANGTSGVGWSRVRALRTLGTPQSGAHTLTLSAVLDQFRTYTASPFTVAAGSSGSTWPSTRQAPEWRLPTQKCASIQIELAASPATAQWSAIALQVAPLATTSPSKLRG